MMKIFKQLYNYWSFIHYCLWDGKYEKANYVYTNFIIPISIKHPILNFFASII